MVRQPLTPADIQRFITQTGFIFEMQVAELLKHAGFKVELGKTFLDIESRKRREIDIVAKKNVNHVELNLIIECKKSDRDVWIFTCSDREAIRGNRRLKHYPIIEQMMWYFHDFHYFDKKFPLAQNYTIFDLNLEKKSTSIQIETCLEKLPKAVLARHARHKDGKKTALFLPVALFSGQIFTVSYDGIATILEDSHVKFPVEIESEAYLNPTLDKNMPTYKEEAAIVKSLEELSPRFQLDFVSNSGLTQYLSTLDERASVIPQWSKADKP